MAVVIAPLVVAIVAANRRRAAEQDGTSREVTPMSRAEFRRLMDEMDRDRERRERRRIPDAVLGMICVAVLVATIIAGTCSVLMLMDVPLPCLTRACVLQGPDR